MVEQTVGIVLAAGASQRMGMPKALLRGADGIPLAVRQTAVLAAGGCAPVVIVLGAESERIRQELPATLRVVENTRWAQGRATSVQAGIVAFPEATSFLFMPVDAVGVKPETVRAILAAAAREPAAIWRPVYQAAKGNLLWVSAAAAHELLNLPPDARVDDWARPQARTLAVDDPAILRNINTPAEWAAFAAQ
ncbi:MAG: nucleotidyltransferase family protein [Kiritimatiellae bacterium]|nr:nucleotidyltransferase family protein [Kiritimatiellia bacterium]MBP9571793.1 nucleotidyltransferase family protein [Kiritimatiellia bacterium]